MMKYERIKIDICYLHIWPKHKVLYKISINDTSITQQPSTTVHNPRTHNTFQEHLLLTWINFNTSMDK